ncbi:MAG TPA: glycosyltransferase family 9 protein [Anaeromyxobacteraceae bacterium]|nr:glycosyltransferase family 9 protein [Anaeromyxobacteraceae bacterium]
MNAILVVRYSALGDVVLATSVLGPLRARFPRARIEWVTSSPYAALLEGSPELAAVHRLDRGGLGGAIALGRALRGRFDVAVDLQNKLKSRLVARAAAPRVIVFRRRTPGRALLALLGADPPMRGPHATDLYAGALRPLGVGGAGRPRIHPSAAARGRAASALAAAGRPRVAVAPGASTATKRWPAERFAEVARALADGGASVVLAGGPSDRVEIDAFRAALGRPVAADLTDLPVDALAAGLAEVDLLLACDSGPVHLAAAVGTPVVAIFGPTSPERWGPPAPGRAVALPIACAPCSNHGGARCPRGHHRCMLDLGAATVIEAARDAMARSPRSPNPE